MAEIKTPKNAISAAQRRLPPVKKFDIAEHLDTPELVAGFISDALDTGDSAFIAGALGIAARAKGMTKIAEDAGLSREQLYRSLSKAGNPTLTTFLAALKALGLEIHASPIPKARGTHP